MKQFYLTLSLLLMLAVNAFSKEKPHVVIVLGTLHYSPELTMPVFAKELENHGFKTTIVKGEGNPENKDELVLPGIEALYEADLAIFFMRFLTLKDQEWKPIEDYFTAGKPVIGLRTANHSFKYKPDHPRHNWNDDFGRRVLGTPYIVHQAGTTEVSTVPQNSKHPIMTHITKTNWVSQGTLYLTRLEGGAVPLAIGTGEGRPRLLNKAFGPIQVNTSESDIIAWAWENEWGGKVFGSSFGHPGDFAEEAFNRMLINSACWATDMPYPSAETKIPTWNITRVDKKKGHK